MKLIVRYLILFVPAYVLMTILWIRVIEPRLYYCSDSGSPLELVPPFVHTYAGIHTGDHYLVSPWIVWTIWSVCIGITLLAPALGVRQFRQRRYGGVTSRARDLTKR
jgi:hypothetical protein